ncbi:MAG: hypothetical protein E4H01_00710 [Lysobacterales bacterium]|nr:MAG: hypothetical protein E4H01_00710 [Xanthomonadales bacterium]
MAEQKEDVGALEELIETETVELDEEEADAALQAGFARQMGEAEKEEATEEEEEEEKQEEEPKVEAKKVEADPNEKRFRNLEGKFGTLNRDMAEVLKFVKESAAAKTDDSPSKEELDAANTHEKTEFLRKEYPEWADAVDEQMNSLKATMIDEEKVKKITSAEVGESTQAVRELTRIDRAAERKAESGDWPSDDWQTTIYSQEFVSWLEEQDDDAKAKRLSDSGRDVIALLDAFEQSRKTPPAPKSEPKKGRRLQDSVPTTTGGGPTRTEQAETMEEAMLRGFKRSRGGQ